MNQTIIVKINVSLIEKERLFKGSKGVYLDLVLIPSKENEYGNDFMVLQSVTKDERLAGKRGAILGNGKFMPRKQDAKPAQRKPEVESGPMSSDVPF